MEKRTDKEYVEEEKRIYIWKKSLTFDSRAKGNYVIARSPKNKTLVTVLYYVGGKTKTKRWWSFNAEEAWIFVSRESAEKQLERFKFDTSDMRIIKVL